MKTFLVVNDYKFLIEDDGSYIKKIELLEENLVIEEPSTLSSLIQHLKDELLLYFCGSLKIFTVPFKADGTEFQTRVWAEMNKIKYGSMKSYGQIANALGGKNYSRAVGGACNKNPLPILIPCHRVSASNHIGGYAYGEKVKRKLLELECVDV